MTGSGKTHSYLVPMFELLDESNADLQFVISAPTRELARQIFDFAKQIASFSPTPIDLRLYTGGTDRDKEITRLQKSKPQFVVGTPGKLKDFTIQERLLPTHQAKMFVVDEADMTLDEGFLADVDQVAATFRRRLRLSSLRRPFRKRLPRFLKNTCRIRSFCAIESERLTNLDIRHSLLKTKERNRIDVLKSLTDSLNPYLAVVLQHQRIRRIRLSSDERLG
ncbi:MAG: DEAD/DEAH box helicase [Bacillus subtilis]|nr:DEAD/DEAH box helicase [Bacillus subtilis]